jgi:prepilin-type N-terminal cleavage/methylation domain-containing protein
LETTRPKASRGFTVMELMIGVAVFSILGLVLLGLLRGGILSSGRSAQEAFLLSNARKAMAGSGPRPGLLDDLQQASAVKAQGAESLALVDPLGSETDYGVYEGELFAVRAGTAAAVGSRVTGLSAAYFARTPDFRVEESTDPATADLVVVSVAVQGRTHGLRVLSGARLMNGP